MCYTLLLMERGICKITDGWWHSTACWSSTKAADDFEMPEELYRVSKYEPPFEELPVCTKLSECKSK